MNGLGRFGIQSIQLSVGDIGEAVDATCELEDLGFGTVWLTQSTLLERGGPLATATKRTVVASSVASIWLHEPLSLADAFHRLNDENPGQILLGLGVSHGPVVANQAPGRVYEKPVSAMNAWLDQLDAAPRPVSAE